MPDDRTARRRLIALHTIGTVVVTFMIVQVRMMPPWAVMITCALATAYAIASRGDRVALGLFVVATALLLAAWWTIVLAQTPPVFHDIPFAVFLYTPVFLVAFIAEWVLRKRTHAASAVAIAAMIAFTLRPMSDVVVPSNAALQTIAILAAFVASLRLMPERWWWRIAEPLVLSLIALALDVSPFNWFFFNIWLLPIVVIPTTIAALLSPCTLFAWSTR